MEDNTKYYEEMVRNRRELHKRPEEGWTEFETTYFVVSFSRSWASTFRSARRTSTRRKCSAAILSSCATAWLAL